MSEYKGLRLQKRRYICQDFDQEKIEEGFVV